MKTLSVGGTNPLKGQGELMKRLEAVLAPVFQTLESGRDPGKDELLDCFTSHRRRGDKVVSPNRAERVENLFTRILGLEECQEQVNVARRVAASFHHIDRLVAGTTDGFNSFLNIMTSVLDEKGGNPAQTREDISGACEVVGSCQDSRTLFNNLAELKGRDVPETPEGSPPKHRRVIFQPGTVAGQAELEKPLDGVLEPVFKVLDPGRPPSREELLQCFTTRRSGKRIVASSRRAERIEALFRRLLAMDKGQGHVIIACRVARVLNHINRIEAGDGTNFNGFCNFITRVMNTHGDEPEVVRETLASACRAVAAYRNKAALSNEIGRLNRSIE